MISYLVEPGPLFASVDGFPGHERRLGGWTFLGGHSRLLRGPSAKESDTFLKGSQFCLSFNLHLQLGTVPLIVILQLGLLGCRWGSSLRGDAAVHRSALWCAQQGRSFFCSCCGRKEKCWCLMLGFHGSLTFTHNTYKDEKLMYIETCFQTVYLKNPLF